MNVNWKNIDSINLSLFCHSLINFPPLIHIPSYAFINFWNPTSYYFLSLSHSLKVECDLEKNSLNIFICHLSFLNKLPPTHKHSLVCIHEFFKPYELYFFEFESFEKKVECELEKKSLSNVIFHLSWFQKLSPTHTHPLVSIYEFLKPCNWFFLEFESFVKDWIEIEKKSLNNFICHLSFLKKLSPIDTHPLISICKFLKPYKLLFF